MASLIYIASLRRSGSTLLAGLLSSLPNRFVLPEPRFAVRGFRVDRSYIDLLAEHDVNLLSIKRAWHANRGDDGIRYFVENALPQFVAAGVEIGIKEIKQAGWRGYLDYFRPIRLITLTRDPRDIYVSVHERLEKAPKRRQHAWPAGFNPETFAEHVVEELTAHQEMSECLGSYALTYERMCAEPAELTRVLKFCGGAPDTLGDPNLFLRQRHWPSSMAREDEIRTTTGYLNTRRIGRWKTASVGLRVEAEAAFQIISRRLPEVVRRQEWTLQ